MHRRPRCGTRVVVSRSLFLSQSLSLNLSLALFQWERRTEVGGAAAPALRGARGGLARPGFIPIGILKGFDTFQHQNVPFQARICFQRQGGLPICSDPPGWEQISLGSTHISSANKGVSFLRWWTHQRSSHTAEALFWNELGPTKARFGAVWGARVVLAAPA